MSLQTNSLPVITTHPVARLAGLYQTVLNRLTLVATYAAPLLLRVALALPFFRSGLTRWDGVLSLSPSTTFLFGQLFRLHILGGEYPIPFSDVVSYLVAVAEIALPILLVFGFGTRLAALGLLLMTGVIQLVVPDGWVNFHLYWAAIAVAIMAVGGGPVSLDRLIAINFRRMLRSKRETP